MKIFLIILSLSFCFPAFSEGDIENNPDKKENTAAKSENPLKIKSSEFITKEKEKYLLPRWSYDDKFIAFTNDQKRGLWILELSNNTIVNPIKPNEVIPWFNWNAKNEIIIPQDKDNSITVALHFSSTVPGSNIADSFKIGGVFEKDDRIYFRSSDGKEALVSLAGKSPVIENDKIIYKIGEESWNIYVQYDGFKKIAMRKDEKNGSFIIIDMWTISPDGKYAVLSDYPSDKEEDNDKKFDLFVIDLTTMKKFNLTATPDISEVHPDFSSNGKKIACADAISNKIRIIDLK